MLDTIAKLNRLLSTRERNGFAILVVVMLCEALLDMASVALVPLYVTALAFPESLLGDERVMAWLPAAWHDGLDRHALIFWGGLTLLAFFAVRAAYTIFATYWKARFAQNRARKLSVRLFRAYLDAPYVFHLRSNASELLRNINQECTQLAARVLLPLVELVSNGLVIAGITGMLVWLLDAGVLLWLLLFLGAGIASAAAMHGRIKHLGVAAQADRARVIRTVTEGLGGVREIRVLRRAGYFVRRLDGALTRIFDVQRVMQVLQRALPTLIELVGIAGLVGVTLMMLARDEPTEAIVATLSVFAVALTRMKGALRGALNNFTDVRHYSPSLDVISCGLDELEDRADPAPSGSPPLTLNEGIELDGIGYRFPGAPRDSLDDISIRVARGEAVGFVGPTGAGKSTLLNILLGILDPDRGAIRVDGEDIRGRAAAWQVHLGYVPQELFLIDGTLVENIALGLEGEQIDRARVAEAAAAAELTPLLERLPQGLDSVVGERGIRLSGGERQRIAIARALYGDPDVLIMDEATSALDNNTEAAVIDGVSALKGRRTIFMVAHRLSTVRRCDRIVYLNAGRIEAIGSYDELRAAHAGFRRMSDA